MRFRRLILSATAFVLAGSGYSLEPASAAPDRLGAFEISFTAGSRDDSGRFMGGTEARTLAVHSGKLYAGNGYWRDRPGPEGPQAAQILVLDAPGARWRVDHEFAERLPDGRWRDLAVAALAEARFTTDGAGRALPQPVAMLLATTWDLTGTVRVFSRDDATGAWTAAILAHDPPAPNFLPQVRSLGLHRDHVTGIEHVFAGHDPRGIFSGTYDAALAGRIRWSAAPELDISTISQAAFPGLAGRLRVSSLTECNGRLYAAVGQQIYERIDAAQPRWRLVYSNPRPGYSETGLRGLTAIANPAGRGEVLLAAVEGNAARIVRVDPGDGSEVTDLDLGAFLGQAWGMPVGYVIAAYNDMTSVADPVAGNRRLIGLDVFIPPGSPIAAGHAVVDVGYGRLEAGGWYLVRHPNGRYDLRQIAPVPSRPDRKLVATRSIRVSPFANDGGALYFAGYDANKAPAHDTAWIVRSAAATAIGASQ